jgi:hypothetical protein
MTELCDFEYTINTLQNLKCIQNLWSENLEGKEHSEDLSIVAKCLLTSQE